MIYFIGTLALTQCEPKKTIQDALVELKTGPNDNKDLLLPVYSESSINIEKLRAQIHHQIDELFAAFEEDANSTHMLIGS